MNSNTFRMPVRRSAAAAAAAALAVGGPVAFAAPAQATGGGDGRASAVVLRTGLDVSLLNKTLNVPLKASLNEVQAPASAEKTALTVQVEGVDQGRPLNVLRAEVASAKATADREKAEGSVTLAHAKVHVPGLPLLSLIEVEEVTSRAVCAAGEKPVAESNLLGTVRVLGKKVTLTAGGTTRVEVPGVGEVRLDVSRRETTSRTAAATALELAVSVNPLKLNVAEVQGSVTLAAATCEAPKPASAVPPAATPSATPSAPPEVEPQTVPKENLAETGGSSATPYVAAGAFALLAAGTAGVALARRRARD
ncbi:SCO1860 family LAETG-anchored protein [Streptomyces sp. FIT100]|uniref:SCO1860 family LAETG-anchored protein n=1 Tax=Streptomyces sp. FIT100 TaxID=2837956 RepID=UPI0021C89081|nr:SCO1860 family LAETG-anchored protein [Streptomyces sp. FIT100]UUN26173.1 LPXTG cell wall anchor domain-containing protein [Streptomyces sp. FIT100]